MSLTFEQLRAANLARIPQFKNALGLTCHLPDGSDWSDADWMTAVLGELGELANFMKKKRRGDFDQTEEFLIDEKIAFELADVVTYLDILAFRLGVDLGHATRVKFNLVSARVGCDVQL